MTKVPADQHIDVGDAGKGNVQHVVTKALAENALRFVSRQQSEGLCRDRQDVRGEHEKFSVQGAHGFRRTAHLRRRHLREHRLESARSEVLHQVMRPPRELRVKAPAQNRGIDVNPLPLHRVTLPVLRCASNGPIERRRQPDRGSSPTEYAGRSNRLLCEAR